MGRINDNMVLLEKRDKKAVSPIIATVLLISIVIVLAAIIFLWARAFLAEKAVKGDRAVEVSCGEVEFESQVIPGGCGAGNVAVDINNIGNVHVYGIKVFKWVENQGLGEVIFDGPFSMGTVTVGKSDTVCLLNVNVQSGDSFRVVPKLLAEQDGKRVAYTCPEKDGITVAYTGV